MQAQPAQEDGEHEQPLEVLKQAGQQALLADAVPHDGQRHVAEPREDDDETEPHLERVEVVLVQDGREVAPEEVVGQREDAGRCDGVVRADVWDIVC